MNYACVMVGAIFILAGAWWIFSARKWFRPRRAGSAGTGGAAFESYNGKNVFDNPPDQLTNPSHDQAMRVFAPYK